MAGDALDAARRAQRQRPLWRPGRIVVPFLVGVFVTLLVAYGVGDGPTRGWLAAAIVVGITAAGVSLGLTLLDHTGRPVHHAQHHPAAKARPGKLADPLAHVRVVEEQHRQLAKPCMNCGTPVRSGAAECPSCGHKQVFACKKCRTSVRPEWEQCPECGAPLR